MEGLLPLVYRAIKKNRTRRQYQCLSSGASLSYINMAEIYPQTQSQSQSQSQSHVYDTSLTQKVAGHLFAGNNNDHRRHKSVGDLDYGFLPSQERTGGGSPTPKQLVRFGSHRMFSCINGVQG